MRRLLFALAFVCAASVVHAQVDRATLSGVVRDQTGAVISGAAVTVTNQASKLTTRGRTTAEGTYQIVTLAPGSYLVEVETAGFKKAAKAVILEVGQKARLDVSLSVGEVTGAVTVEAASKLLNTEQATLGASIDETSVSKLPLAIRNWDDLLALAAPRQLKRRIPRSPAQRSGHESP